MRDDEGSSSMPNPLLRGGVLAVVAAVAFGVTTPLVQKFGRLAGPIPVATLLYTGAALVSFPLSARRGEEAPVRLQHMPRLALVAVLGAVVAPVCLVWGLQHESGTSASLLLNLEAVFTVILGWGLYREHVSGRVAFALVSMVAGGACVVASGESHRVAVSLGALAVVAATLGWALDNALTRPLADLNPTAVVFWKSGLGATLGLGLSLALGQPFPGPRGALVLLACGATGYGISLRLYLLAQRRIGAGRTGSIFALAPFVGALVALAMGESSGGVATLAASVLFVAGLALHLTERHRHDHTHDPIEHEHAHRHDDGHHDHHHDPPLTGSHSHPHRHETRSHGHPHGADLHHQHRHS